jgi:hypothetical protein
LLCGFEQRRRYSRIVNALEEPEEAGPLMVKLDVLVVYRSGNAAYNFFIAEGEKILNLCMQMKRMLASVQQSLDFREQWRDPIRISLVNLPWESEKLVEAAASANREYAHLK